MCGHYGDPIVVYMVYINIYGVNFIMNGCIRPIVEPWIQEEQSGFRPGCGALGQLYTLTRVIKGLWEVTQPVHMCFVDEEDV